MCVGALVHARVERVVYGAADPKVGALALADDLAARHALNHRLRFQGGILADTAADLLRGYFEDRRRGA
jgi:tRNA(adenine34) deaminase